MKTPVIILLTNDQSIEECLAQVLLEMGGLSHLALSASDVLDLICGTGHDFELAVIDCEHGPHGLTLVGAISRLPQTIPTIVLTGPDQKYIEALAYANGATICLSKPISTTELSDAMKHCRQSKPQLAIVA